MATSLVRYGRAELRYVRSELNLWRGRWRLVAEGSKVSRRTIEKIAYGIIIRPGPEKIDALARFFRAEAARAAKRAAVSHEPPSTPPVTEAGAQTEAHA